MYLRLIRPRLLHALQLLSQFTGDPSSTAVAPLAHYLRLILATKMCEYSFYYAQDAKSISVVGVTDATWATNKKNGKSLRTHFLYVGPSLIQASSKEQRYVATSSASAELCPLFIAAKRTLWCYSYIKGIFWISVFPYRFFKHSFHMGFFLNVWFFLGKLVWHSILFKI